MSANSREGLEVAAGWWLRWTLTSIILLLAILSSRPSPVLLGSAIPGLEQIRTHDMITVTHMYTG